MPLAALRRVACPHRKSAAARQHVFGVMSSAAGRHSKKHKNSVVSGRNAVFWGPWNGSYYYARGAGYRIAPGFAGAKHWSKQVNSSSAWRINKLGGLVDPEGVQDGGTQFTHGTWGKATVETEAGEILSLQSIDASNMNPMTARFPVGNPLPASYNKDEAISGLGLARLQPGSVVGMAVNLHNNLWNTNYPLYYPYFHKRYCSNPLKCKNANLLFRFRLSATSAHAAPTFI